MELGVKPIGIIRTPFTSSDGIPIQSSKSEFQGEIIIREEFVPGLKSLDLFSHIILLYWFDRAKPAEMQIVPYLDKQKHGLFSTRIPSRPNPIGISIVQLVNMTGNIILFNGADMLDRTPLLDIKPFVPEFDNRLGATSGWLISSMNDESRSFVSDRRFQN